MQENIDEGGSKKDVNLKTTDQIYLQLCAPFTKCPINIMTILAVTLSQVVLRTGSELDLIHLSDIVFLSIRSAMAEPEALALEGPGQNGRGKHGQYVYWIVMAHPTPETLAQKAVKTPEDFTTSTPKSLPSLCQSTSTRPKCPRHTKNHHFRAGACSGACWFLKEKKAFLL